MRKINFNDDWFDGTKTATEIATLAGCTVEYIYTYARKNKKSYKSTEKKKYKNSKILNSYLYLFNGENSAKDIRKITGVCNDAIYHFAKVNNLKLKKIKHIDIETEINAKREEAKRMPIRKNEWWTV